MLYPNGSSKTFIVGKSKQISEKNSRVSSASSKIQKKKSMAQNYLPEKS